MTKAQIAWVAGIVEGEGCLYLGKYGVARWRRCVVSVKMTDRDIVMRLPEWVGYGTTYTYQPRKRSKKRVWEWTVTRQEDVLRFVRMIRPWLGNRRGRKADKLIAEIERKREEGGLGRGRQHRAKAHCPKGHPYSGENLIGGPGKRGCRVCDAEAGRRWRERNPERVRDVRRAAKRRYYAKNAARLRREALARYHARKTA